MMLFRLVRIVAAGVLGYIVFQADDPILMVVMRYDRHCQHKYADHKKHICNVPSFSHNTIIRDKGNPYSSEKQQIKGNNRFIPAR